MKRLFSLLLSLALVLPMTSRAGALWEEKSFPITFQALASEAQAVPLSLPANGVFDQDQPGYGAQLQDEIAIQVYQAMLEQLRPGVTRVTTPLGNQTVTDWNPIWQSMMAALSAFFFDHPEYQFASASSYGTAGGKLYLDFIPSATAEEDHAELAALLDDFARNFDTSLPVAEQYRIIHDYVCELASYNDAAAGSGVATRAHTAFGLLVDDDPVVCEGYSKSFKVLCDAVGLPCILVVGESIDLDRGESFSGDSNHMWNAVEVNGQWYAVDTTWDDMDEYTLPGCSGLELSMITYDYFLNNAPFLEGSPEQNHRSTGHIFFPSGWPMHFGLPDLVSGSYGSYETQEATITFLKDDLTIPENFWRYTVDGVELAQLRDITLRMTRSVQLTDTYEVPSGYTYTLDSLPGRAYTLSTAASGPLFRAVGDLKVEDALLKGSAGVPLVTLNGGSFTDLRASRLASYFRHTGGYTGAAVSYQADYDSDGRMLRLVDLGSVQMGAPGIYATGTRTLADGAASAGQFLVNAATFAPLAPALRR